MARTHRYSDIGEYIHFMRRIIRAAGERVSEADPDQLRELLELRNDLDDAIAAAIRGQKDAGATWADIGAVTGTTRQSAYEKWARKVADSA